jgi:hypothetical protein
LSRPRNTRDEIIPIPAIHGVHLPGAIEAQEAAGGAAMAAGDCEIIPASGATDDELTALGFVLGPADASDRLFRQATLPPGWKRAGTGHSMHTDIVDELGRKRIGIFYKAAWYDRRADLHITTVFGYVGDCIYKGTTPVLDEIWATRETVLEAISGHRKRSAERLATYEQHDDDYFRELTPELRAEIARCDEMTAALTERAEQLSGGDT